MNTFEELDFSEDLMRSIKRLGFEKPTTIQAESIPHILKGKDILGESATGSGKTLAFGAGVLENTVPKGGLQALILTPTRELAEQVKNALKELDQKRKFRMLSIYGGVAIGPQMDELQRSEIVIATPGRFKDHLQRGTVDTSRINTLVLDEADRMLDMGFIDDIEDIIRSCPQEGRQTLFFSATFPPQIENLARKHLYKPIKITAEPQVDPEKLKQIYYDVPKNMKLSLLVHLIKNEESDLIMVFCNTRRSNDLIVSALKQNGIDAIALHGGFTQNKRTQAMDNFKDGKKKVMVCTNVAARGIHVENITHIYNYEIPSESTDYVHRIGRTARAGEEGIVINLLADSDHDNFARILRDYRDFDIERVKTPFVERISFKTDSPRGSFSRGGRGGDSRGGPRRGNGPRRDGPRSGPRRDGPRSGPRRDGPRRDNSEGPRRDGPKRNFGNQNRSERRPRRSNDGRSNRS